MPNSFYANPLRVDYQQPAPLPDLRETDVRIVMPRLYQDIEPEKARLASPSDPQASFAQAHGIYDYTAQAIILPQYHLDRKNRLCETPAIDTTFWHETAHHISRMTGAAVAEEFMDSEACDMARLTKEDIRRSGFKHVVEAERGGNVLNAVIAREEKFAVLFAEHYGYGGQCRQMFTAAAQTVARVDAALRLEMAEKPDFSALIPGWRQRSKVVAFG